MYHPFLLYLIFSARIYLASWYEIPKASFENPGL